jgi:hypothetical protein
VSKTAPSVAFSGKTKALWAAVLLGVYCLLGTWGQFDFSDLMGYYNMLADAFLDGHLYIRPAPQQIALQDMIPFEGRYYLQWGPFPGVLHMAAKLAGLLLSDRVACLLAAWLASVVFFDIVIVLRCRYFPGLPAWVCPVFLLGFAFAGPTPVLAFEASIYHESILISSLCIVLMFRVLLGYLETPGVFEALLSGGALALALTTRISMALYGLAVIPAVAATAWRRDAGLRGMAVRVAACAAPVAAGGLLMMAYNHARFGSPWEFGLKYARPAGHRVYALDRIPENFRHYVLAPPRFSRELPWIEHKGWPPLVKTERAEDMSSLFLGSPFLLLLAVAGRHFRKASLAPLTVRILIATAAAAGLLEFLSLLCLDGASRRYMQDFFPPWMIVAFAGAGALRTGAAWGRWRLAAVAAVGLPALLHIHLSFFQFVTGAAADPNLGNTFVQFAPLLRRIAPSRQLDDQEAITRNDLGVVSLARGRPLEALRHFERAAELMPDSPRIQENLQIARRLARRKK